MWTASPEPLAQGRTLRFVLKEDSAPLSYAAVLRHWQQDEEFRSFFIALLAEAPFSAFRWETPPMTLVTANRPFEFVLLDSPELATRKLDVNAFAEHFQDGATAVEFANLGKDAILVVPCPQGPPMAYGHIAAFVRQASPQQKHDLWTLVGAAMQRRLDHRPVWLSTAGGAVAWLHVRLDDRPKYYGYQPYTA